jgi:pimeloyl-ACP methyl ester carboxylesterase
VPHAHINGLDLFYTEHGAGDPLLLVHGAACDGNDWAWQIPALSEKHRVIAMDLRGHGRSEIACEGYTPAQFAADAAGLLDALGAGPAVVIGHSLGSAVALALAVAAPGRVRALVDVDGALARSLDARAAIGAMVASLAEDAHNTLIAYFARGAYTPASPAHLAAWHRRRIASVPPHVIQRLYDGLLDEPAGLWFREVSGPLLAGLGVPVLAFRREPEVAAWERPLLTHPHSRVVTFEGCGHWLHQERPSEFNAIVNGWLARLPGN